MQVIEVMEMEDVIEVRMETVPLRAGGRRRNRMI